VSSSQSSFICIFQLAARGPCAVATRRVTHDSRASEHDPVDHIDSFVLHWTQSNKSNMLLAYVSCLLLPPILTMRPMHQLGLRLVAKKRRRPSSSYSHFSPPRVLACEQLLRLTAVLLPPRSKVKSYQERKRTVEFSSVHRSLLELLYRPHPNHRSIDPSTQPSIHPSIHPTTYFEYSTKQDQPAK
jgi:hypothetical protein